MLRNLNIMKSAKVEKELHIKTFHREYSKSYCAGMKARIVPNGIGGKRNKYGIKIWLPVKADFHHPRSNLNF
jgi:hypothetical protein